jgi:hypothetical protein
MPKVTAAMQRILKEKDRAILTGTEAMRDILKDLQAQVRVELGKAAIGSWDAYSLRRALDSIETQVAQHEAAAKTEGGDLLDKSWKLGKDLVDGPLIAAGMGEIYTGFHLSTAAIDALKGYQNDYLERVFGDAWYRVKGEVTLGVLGSKTPQEVAAAIGEKLDGPGIFNNIAARAETITQTEMGRVFSEASQLRMEQAGEHVPGLEKQWRHVGHPRQPRPTHLAADGQHVPVNEPFRIGGTMMMFPRDPGAPIEETINCGCDHVPYHANWA